MRYFRAGESFSPCADRLGVLPFEIATKKTPPLQAAVFIPLLNWYRWTPSLRMRYSYGLNKQTLYQRWVV